MPRRKVIVKLDVDVPQSVPRSELAKTIAAAIKPLPLDESRVWLRELWVDGADYGVEVLR